MGLFKRIGKAVKRTVNKATRQVERSAKQIGGISGIPGLGGKDKGGEDDARSAAANSLVKKNVTRQAGEGAINFNTEEELGR